MLLWTYRQYNYSIHKIFYIEHLFPFFFAEWYMLKFSFIEHIEMLLNLPRFIIINIIFIFLSNFTSRQKVSFNVTILDHAIWLSLKYPAHYAMSSW